MISTTPLFPSTPSDATTVLCSINGLKNNKALQYCEYILEDWRKNIQ